MSIRLASVSIEPPVLLAPLAGITDLPFRQLVASFGAGLVVSEMVATQELVQAKPAARAKAELGFDQHATSVQLAGRDAYWLAEPQAPLPLEEVTRFAGQPMLKSITRCRWSLRS